MQKGSKEKPLSIAMRRFAPHALLTAFTLGSLWFYSLGSTSVYTVYRPVGNVGRCSRLSTSSAYSLLPSLVVREKEDRGKVKGVWITQHITLHVNSCHLLSTFVRMRHQFLPENVSLVSFVIKFINGSNKLTARLL